MTDLSNMNLPTHQLSQSAPASPGPAQGEAFQHAGEMPAVPGLTRRRFLASSAMAVAGFTLVPRHVLGGPKFVAPSEKVNIAIVGCGGQGQVNVRNLFTQADAQIVAVADPIEYQDLHAFYFNTMSGRLPLKEEIEKHFSEKTPNYKVADYEDFRVMLEKEKAIDAILCATPDHNHAYVSINAMRQGK